MTSLTEIIKVHCLTSNMAPVSVVMVFVLVCMSSFQLVSSQKGRNKRNVDTSIQSVLQSFLKRIDQMKALIRKQDKMINEQNRSIKRLRSSLRGKGTQERLNEIDSDVKHQSILIQHDAKLPSLTAYKNAIDKSEAKMKRISKSIIVRSKIVKDMYNRLVMRDKRIDCKIFNTSWKKQADHMIGSLSKHLIECQNQEFLQSFFLQRKDGGLDSPVRYEYRCCRYNVKDKWSPNPKNNNDQ